MNKIRQFMQGRYGTDKLNQVLMGISMILLVLQIFLKYPIFFYAAWMLIICVYYRTLSKNFEKRYAENQQFLARWNPIEKWFRIKYKQLKEIKTHRYLKCSQCKQYIRVPRKKGAVQVRCPKCSHTFESRT